MSTWDGRRVSAAAIENVNPTGSSRVVLLTSKVQGGAVSLFCARSLHENYDYPSWAVFVDVNGDGHCSDGDVGSAAQLFGWNFSVEEELMASWLDPVASLAPPIGSAASTFCAGYFE